MEEIRQEGLVIRVYPSGESDLILRLVTPSLGKVSAIAKHARKSKRRFLGGFEVFDRGEFCMRRNRSSLYTVESCSRLPLWRPLRENLDKFTIASLIAECFDLILKEDDIPGPEAYDTLCLGFEALSEANDTKQGFRAAYLSIAQLLEFSGFHASHASTAPSAQNLRKLLLTVEQTTEQALKTRPAVEEVLERLRD